MSLATETALEHQHHRPCPACGLCLEVVGQCLVCGSPMAVHAGRDNEIWDCRAQRAPCGQGHLALSELERMRDGDRTGSLPGR